MITAKEFHKLQEQNLIPHNVRENLSRQMNVSMVHFEDVVWDKEVIRFPQFVLSPEVALPQDKAILQRYHKKNLRKFLDFALPKMEIGYRMTCTATDSEDPTDMYEALIEKTDNCHFMLPLRFYYDAERKWIVNVEQNLDKVHSCDITYRLIASTIHDLTGTFDDDDDMSYLMSEHWEVTTREYRSPRKHLENSLLNSQ